MALTDHDSLAGLDEFTAAAEGFEAVPGVEMSTLTGHAEVHVLGYFVSPGDPALEKPLVEFRKVRDDRIHAMREKLAALGLHVPPDRLETPREGGSVGRPHLALAMVDLGFVSTVDEAFRKYLRRGKPAFVPRPAPDTLEVIRWIHQAGGKAVLAHPGILRRNGWIADFAKAGLDGLEVWHPRHSEPQRRNYLRLAGELDLVPTGGSDYHGPRVGDAVIGQEPVPLESLERLRERSVRSPRD